MTREWEPATDGYVKLAELVLQMHPWLLEFRTSCGKVACKQVGEACDELVAKWSSRSW